MLVYAGIDEAGYGPLLGPLCVGLSVFRVPCEADAPPDLWSLLKRAVSREPDARGKRIAVADSKALKLANSVTTRHPLVHLERGALSFLGCLGSAPDNDLGLCECLGARFERTPWYGGDASPVPLAHTPGEVAVSRSRLAAALEIAGVEVLALRCTAVSESEVNRAVRERHSKAEATMTALGAHLRRVADVAGGHGRAAIVCDRLGGRTSYRALLERELPGAAVSVVAESGAASCYEVHVGSRRIDVRFMPEAESHHLPVALASMLAKYVRELAMARFNRHWCGRLPDLKPTAGYRGDGWRWLRDAAPILSGEDRAALVRIA
ncbi:MAG: hypothetical protein IT437_04135 [Phycisphaerales bacterium]|nr:hypothetical protein [Phycisphaerales bacterium]